MRKFLFLVLILSAVGMGGGEHANKSPSPTEKSDGKKERTEGAGLSDKTSDVLGSATDLEQNLDNPDFKEKIEGLSPDEKEELKTEIEKRQLETADNEQKKRFQLVLNLLDKNEKEETHSSTASSKPTGTASAKPAATEMKKNKNRAFPNGYPSPIHELPGGRYAYAYLDKAGKPVLTADGQPVWAVGKDGAPTLDGLYPLSGLGLNYENGKLSIDPKASMHTVSTGNGPQVNSTVPVIFTSEGKAIARQGIIQNGKQNLYYTEGGKTFSSGITDGEVTAVGDKELPGVLTVAINPSGTAYVTVSAPAEENLATSYSEEVKRQPLLQLAPVAQTPSTLSPNDLRKAFDQRMEMLVTSVPAPEATAPQTATVSESAADSVARLMAAANVPRQQCFGPNCQGTGMSSAGYRRVCTKNRGGGTTCRTVRVAP